MHATANRANRERNVRNHKTTDLSSSDHIKSCYLNSRSIRNKFFDLEKLAAIGKFDIIAIIESSLNTKDRDFLAEYNLPGFSIFSCDRENQVGCFFFFFFFISEDAAQGHKKKR